MSESYITDLATGERLPPALPGSIHAAERPDAGSWPETPTICAECGEIIPQNTMAYGVFKVGSFHTDCYHRWEGHRMIAKFRCDKITHYVGTVPVTDEGGRPVPAETGGYPGLQQEAGKVIAFEMSPVYHGGDPDHENAKFWAASPSGKFTLEVANLAACGILEAGAEYYIEIRRAP